MSTKVEKEYKDSVNALGIRTSRDPFPTSPPSEVDYWADNKEVQSRIIQAEIHSIMFTSSSLYVFWGPLGVGKTFAAAYLANSKVLDKIITRFKLPDKARPLVFRVVAPVPVRTGDLTFSVHKSLVEKIFVEIGKDQELMKALARAYTELPTGTIKSAFRDLGSHVRKTIENVYSIEGIERSDGFKLLVQEKSKLGKSEDVNDLVLTMKILLRLLLKKNRRISVMIDELENLARSTVTERLLFSDYMRRLIDEVDSGLTVILIFTFDSNEDVNRVIQSALLSRLSDQIEFGNVRDAAHLKEYIEDCLRFRAGKEVDEIMESSLLNRIADAMLAKYKNGISFRQINREMHTIFATTYLFAGQPKKYKITTEIYNRSMKMTADDILRQLD